MAGIHASKFNTIKSMFIATLYLCISYNYNKKQRQQQIGSDGGTKFILRIKEQEKHLTLQKHDDDDEETTIFSCIDFTD